MSKQYLVDKLTGEMMPVNISTHRQKHRYGFKMKWAATGIEFFSKLADAKLSATDFRVLGYLLEHAEYENKVYLTIKLLTDELDMLQPNVSRSIKKLKDNDLIFDNRSNGKGFMLNPDYIWFGSAKSHNEYMKENLKKSLQ